LPKPHIEDTQKQSLQAGPFPNRSLGTRWYRGWKGGSRWPAINIQMTGPDRDRNRYRNRSYDPSA